MFRGYGFGFRGSSPPWPYVGRGRGGLPRCWALTGTMLDYQQPLQAGQASYPQYGIPWSTPFYGATPAPGTMPSASQMTKEQELDFLKDQAEIIKEQLEQIDVRIHELEAREKEV